jgi:hypothetical protein
MNLVILVGAKLILRFNWGLRKETKKLSKNVSPEDGDSMFLRNVGIYLQKTNTAVRTSVPSERIVGFGKRYDPKTFRKQNISRDFR